MNCTSCKKRVCRNGDACKATVFDTNKIMQGYSNNLDIVKAAAKLVDGGRAGTLSRLQEIIEFSKTMNYQKIGLAYCYGMEEETKLLAGILKAEGLKPIPVSCTVGGITQDSINPDSNIANVSCNPIGQAAQLNNSGANLVVTIGLCLGHDILFNKNIKTNTTTLVVKDRVHNHSPLAGLAGTTRK